MNINKPIEYKTPAPTTTITTNAVIFLRNYYCCCDFDWLLLDNVVDGNFVAADFFFSVNIFIIFIIK